MGRLWAYCQNRSDSISMVCEKLNDFEGLVKKLWVFGVQGRDFGKDASRKFFRLLAVLVEEIPKVSATRNSKACLNTNCFMK